jgi:hypothetical protein
MFVIVPIHLLPFALSRGMAAMLYRGPNTGFRVQGYTVDETIARDHDAYEPVTCLACKLVHLVNPKSGKVFVAGGTSGAHTPRENFVYLPSKSLDKSPAGGSAVGVAVVRLTTVPSRIQKERNRRGQETDHACDDGPINLKNELVNHCRRYQTAF